MLFDIPILFKDKDFGNYIAIFLERIRVKPSKKFIKGYFRYGYGITKKGDFLFKLPSNYYSHYGRYTFNIALISVLLIIAMIFFIF